MRGPPQASTARLLTIAPGRRWRSRISSLIRRRRTLSDEQLEVIARLASERRRLLRSGEYRPELRTPRRF